MSIGFIASFGNNLHLLKPFNVDECMKLLDNYEKDKDDEVMFMQLIKLAVLYTRFKDINYMKLDKVREIEKCKKRMIELDIFHPWTKVIYGNMYHKIKQNNGVKDYSKCLEEYSMKCEKLNINKVLIIAHGSKYENIPKSQVNFINEVLYLDHNKNIEPDIVMDMFVLDNWKIFPNNYFNCIHFHKAPIGSMCADYTVDKVVSLFTCIIDKIYPYGMMTFNHKFSKNENILEIIDEAKKKCNKLDIKIKFGSKSYDDLKKEN